jgi:hypothetical protein
VAGLQALTDMACIKDEGASARAFEATASPVFIGGAHLAGAAFPPAKWDNHQEILAEFFADSFDSRTFPHALLQYH